MSAPSLLTYSIPAKSVINTPETKNASDKIWIFTVVLCVKKPFDQITRKAINASIPKQIAYFVKVSFVSCFIVISPSTLLLDLLLVFFLFNVVAVYEMSGGDLTERGRVYRIIVLRNGIVDNSGALLLIHGIGQRNRRKK